MLMHLRSCSLTTQIALLSTLSSSDYVRVSGHLLIQWRKWDGLWHPPEAVKEQEFLKEQIQTKIAAKHFLELFRMELLPGMYSLPVHTMPKPDSDMMWLIIDHSSRDFNPNSMITQKDVMGVWLYGLHTLGVSIMWIKHDFPDANLYRSNLLAAYHQLPMHSLYQILQIATVDSQRYINRNNNFSGQASQIIWQSFMLLVIWILVFWHSIGVFKCYIDDAFLVTRAENVSWYEPYCWAIPTD